MRRKAQTACRGAPRTARAPGRAVVAVVVQYTGTVHAEVLEHDAHLGVRQGREQLRRGW